MESLVNYSSEDEQDEPSYKRPAERSNPINRGGVGGGYSGSSNAGSSARSSHRDEASDSRYKSYSGGNRSSSFQRDNKERYGPSRDVRDSRDFNNGHQRFDNRSTHDRHYQRHGRDYKSYNQNSRDNRHRYREDTSRRDEGDRRHEPTRERRENTRTHMRNAREDTNRREENERRYESTRGRREHRHRRSRSRSRSRSHSKDRKTFERSERSATSTLYEADTSPVREKIVEKSQQNFNRSAEQPVHQIAPLMSLPLSDSAPKHPSLVAVTSTIAAGSANSSSNEPAVIQLPNYYNPSVMNPTKYAEQVQKRKLLWGAKKNEDTSAKWGNAQFSQDADGKVASKFMRLMGIKNASGAKSEPEEKAATSPDVKSREAMFSTMEHQYEVARQVTHTMRGVGLGFGVSRPF